MENRSGLLVAAIEGISRKPHGQETELLGG